MTKNTLLLLPLLFCFFKLNAQEKTPIKVRIEPGVLFDTASENLGLLLNVEPKINISNKTVIGLRFGVSVNAQKFENNGSTPFIIDDTSDNAIISFVPAIDYYLGENHIRPFMGIGLGYYIVSQVAIANPTNTVDEGSVNNQLGLLLRGGIEFGNIRVGLEYNFIPKAEIELPNNQILGEVENSYLGLSIGFTIGGRKT